MEPVPTPLFSVKRYAHPEYKSFDRAKVNGRWQRGRFGTEAGAIVFARQQNARSESTEKNRPERSRETAKSRRAPNAAPASKRLATAGPLDRGQEGILACLIVSAAHRPPQNISAATIFAERIFRKAIRVRLVDPTAMAFAPRFSRSTTVRNDRPIRH